MNLHHLENIRPETREKLEEAQFAVMMDEFAAEYGEQLLEESRRLNEDESFEYPEELDQKCLKAIEHSFAKKKRAEKLHRLRKAGSIAAVLVLVCAIAFGTAFTAVEAFRVKVLNFALEIKEGDIGTALGLSQEAHDSLDSLGGEYGPLVLLSPSWIPDGYDIDETTYTTASQAIDYINESGNIISFFQGPITTGSFIDTEDAEPYETTINDCPAYVSIRGEQVILHWVDSQNLSVFQVVSEHFDIESAIKMAESCY